MKELVEQFAAGLLDSVTPSPWINTWPSNVRGFGHSREFMPGYTLSPHANTGGQDAAGSLATPPGGTTTALGTVGTAWTGANYAVAPNDFSEIVTALVVRNIMDNLRDKAVIMQEGSFIRASHVPGTNQLRYTVFGDLAAAEDLLEGVPPQTEGLAWDTQEFTGKQKGKLVAITDLAEDFSPFDLYRTAAEKIAWNAIDTAEKDAIGLINAAGTGITFTGVAGQAADTIVNATVALKTADVPMFPDGSYHALVSPADAALIMTQTGEKGWTDTIKYANAKALLNGELGAFRGVRFVESNRITTGQSLVFGPDFLIWGDFQTIRAYRVAPGGDHADPLAQRGLVGWKGMWGVKINAFSGTPAVGPASNPTALRYLRGDLTP